MYNSNGRVVSAMTNTFFVHVYFQNMSQNLCSVSYSSEKNIAVTGLQGTLCVKKRTFDQFLLHKVPQEDHN